MPKKNVYMVQTSIKYEDTMYLPYTVGALVAFAWNDKTVDTAYTLKKILCTREDIETAAAAMETPYLVAFSN